MSSTVWQKKVSELECVAHKQVTTQERHISETGRLTISIVEALTHLYVDPTPTSGKKRTRSPPAETPLSSSSSSSFVDPILSTAKKPEALFLPRPMPNNYNVSSMAGITLSKLFQKCNEHRAWSTARFDGSSGNKSKVMAVLNFAWTALNKEEIAALKATAPDGTVDPAGLLKFTSEFQNTALAAQVKVVKKLEGLEAASVFVDAKEGPEEATQQDSQKKATTNAPLPNVFGLETRIKKVLKDSTSY